MGKKGSASKQPYVQRFRWEISRFIDDEINENDRLRAARGTKSLDSLLKPIIYTNADHSELVATCGISCDADLCNTSFSDILKTVSGDSIYVYRKKYKDLSVSIESRAEKMVDSFVLRGTSGGSQVFRVEYNKPKNLDAANITFFLSRGFVEERYGADMFISVWRRLLLDSIMDVTPPKTRAAEPLETKLKGFGLEIYSGNIDMDSVAGYQSVKEQVEMEVIFPFLHQSELESIIKRTRKGDFGKKINAALFYGPPGTGKTLMAKVISSDSKIKFVYMPLSKIFSKYYSESARRMDLILDSVNEYSKTVGKTMLFIDELDYISKRRNDSAVEVEDSRVIDTMLTKLDGLLTNNGNLLVIGATNLYENTADAEKLYANLYDIIDGALLSRFATKIYFNLPTADDRKAIIRTYAKQLDDAEVSELAAKTDGFSGRDISYMADIAAKYLIFDIARGKTDEKVPGLHYYIKAIGGPRKTGGNNPDSLYR